MSSIAIMQLAYCIIASLHDASLCFLLSVSVTCFEAEINSSVFLLASSC